MGTDYNKETSKLEDNPSIGDQSDHTKIICSSLPHKTHDAPTYRIYKENMIEQIESQQPEIGTFSLNPLSFLERWSPMALGKEH